MQADEDEPDPLDAFMDGEVLPEVAAKAAAEAAGKEAARLQKAQEKAVRCPFRYVILGYHS